MVGVPQINVYGGLVSGAQAGAEMVFVFAGQVEDTFVGDLAACPAGDTRAFFMGQNGEKVRGGQEIRLVDVPCDVGPMGIFEDIHGANSPGEFSDQLRLAATTYTGTAYVPYLENIIEILGTTTDFPAYLREQRDDFIKRNVKDDASSQVRSVCGRFAVVAAAGELASLMGITGWPEGVATQAAVTCLKAWLAARGTEGDHDIDQGVRAVVAFIEKFAITRFQTIATGDGDFTFGGMAGRVGYRKNTADQESGIVAWQYYVLPEAFQNEVCRGYNATAIATELAKRGLLLRGDGRNLTKKVSTPDGRVRVYHLTSYILSGETNYKK